MSSMRNAVSRRNHKERSQPEARSKWGILEKHKDYSLRAKDYNLKKTKLKVLSQKTREKHPDEFAFGMLSADKGVQGKHGRGNQDKNRLSHDAVKLLKTQDSGYLRTVAARGRKEIDRLSEQVGLDGILKRTTGSSERRIVFDESGEPPVKKRRVSNDELDRENAEDLEDVGRDNVEQAVVVNGAIDGSEAENAALRPKSRKRLEREKEISRRLKATRRRRKELREQRAAKLVDLQKRQKQILAAADQLELQRAKMAKVVGGTNKNGVKFKIRERKK